MVVEAIMLMVVSGVQGVNKAALGSSVPFMLQIRDNLTKTGTN